MEDTLKSKMLIKDNGLGIEVILKIPDMLKKQSKFRYSDVQKAVLKDEDNLIELIGKLSGLRLTYNMMDGAQKKINELTSEYLNKKTEIFGDFEEPEIN